MQERKMTSSLKYAELCKFCQLKFNSDITVFKFASEEMK